MLFKVIAENALFLWNFNTQKCLTFLKTFKATFYSLFTKKISCDDEESLPQKSIIWYDALTSQ